MRRSDDATIPYYSFSRNCRQLKLKNDYIAGLGDPTDLAIIGGHRDARDEQELGFGKARLDIPSIAAVWKTKTTYVAAIFFKSSFLVPPFKGNVSSNSEALRFMRTMIEGAREMRTLPPVRTCRDR